MDHRGQRTSTRNTITVYRHHHRNVQAGDVINIAAVNQVNPMTRECCASTETVCRDARRHADCRSDTITISPTIMGLVHLPEVDALPLSGRSLLCSPAPLHTGQIGAQNLLISP